MHLYLLRLTPRLSTPETSTSSRCRPTSSHQRCHSHRSSWGRRTESPADVEQRTRTHPPQPAVDQERRGEESCDSSAEQLLVRDTCKCTHFHRPAHQHYSACVHVQCVYICTYMYEFRHTHTPHLYTCSTHSSHTPCYMDKLQRRL